jgi:hypothetical protein
MTIQLTPAQHAILAHAIEHTDGKILWFPDNIKGGARKKVIDSMFNRALITPLGDDWFVTAEGYDALGLPRPGPVTIADPEIEATVTTTKPRSRDNSKQAQVIAMLKRPEGATIQQIVEVTGWQAHTVRGTFAGAFKKKLGLNLVSEKTEGGDRIYRVN